jgi:septin family protein
LQTNSDFDAKPTVMLLGQYSTGKTTFIKHLLKTSYPGLGLYFIQNNYSFRGSHTIYFGGRFLYSISP